MTTFCLAMIVKNEAHCIRRCLESVKPYIAQWVVCDTGSTDGTQEIVREALRDIPGQLHQDEWRDFAHNRSLSVRAARESGCDYIWVIDADEWCEVDEPAALEDLTAPCYVLRSQGADESVLMLRLLRADLPWRYEGALHEYPTFGEREAPTLLTGVRVITDHNGARSQDPAKWDKDIAVLEREFEADPFDARACFYLAMTYALAGREQEAAKTHLLYLQFAPAEGQEYWYTLYRLGQLCRRGAMEDDPAKWFLRAYAAFPRAIEPLFWLGRHYLDRGEAAAALPYFELASRKAMPESLFLREDTLYAYEARLFCALACVRVGLGVEAAEIVAALEAEGALPEGALAAAEAAVLSDLQAGEEVAGGADAPAAHDL